MKLTQCHKILCFLTASLILNLDIIPESFANRKGDVCGSINDHVNLFHRISDFLVKT